VEYPLDRVDCTSPKLIVGIDGVTQASCLTCYCCDHEPVAAVQPIAPCSHLLKRARDDAGNVKRRLCEGCGGKPVDLFVCDHPGTPSEIVLHDCTTCRYRPESLSVIDRVYLVNLRKRPERLASFRALQESAGWRLPEVRILEAIDGDVVGVPSHFRQGGGAWGCLRSHCSILERCLMDGVSSVLILEDDVEWFPDAWDRLARFLEVAPRDWSQLMLGGQHQQTPDKIADGVVRCKNTQRTHAYAIRGEAMKSLLRSWLGSSVHIDWVMGGDWQRGWPVYAPDPFIFGQRGGKSDISGRLNNSLYWNAPMDQVVIALDAPPVVARDLRCLGLHMGFKRNSEGVDSGLQTIVTNGARSEDLQKYVETLNWEVASMRGKTTTVWCPGLDLERVSVALSGAVRIVRGLSVAQCLKQCIGLDLKLSFSSSHVLLVRASRETVHGLVGFHRGYWLDEKTGEDKGLQEAVAGDVVEGLKRWAKHTFEESERQQAVPLVWHDGITLSDVKLAFPDRQSLELAGDTAAVVLREWRLKTAVKVRSGRVRKQRVEPMSASKPEQWEADARDE
jgi:GR25 family glycosyltransferase involved in LPS biosynthesis